ncbi:hypothetical protein GCM10007103_25880 [Salinimicrobium marinum]|uniref:Uncharacterized protein n=1 Tax=Salinimicrobium marinum TaxID=680283 RepID=A0A918W0P5_9FLAO|nr:hypothetical protein [Salinimicrobium marinum]GHA43549.1 hypothetical protein GCM10007103_25880 [Salinimicrobium marinum]
MNTQEYKPLFKFIRSQIQDLRASEVEAKLDVYKLKNTLENLRSALDYLAADIKEYYGYKNQSSFPYSDKDEKTFKNYVNQKFPNLDRDHPELYETLKDVQPFLHQNNWLEILNKKVNLSKHNTPRISEAENYQGIEILGIADLNNLERDIFIDLKNYEGHGSGNISVKNGTLNITDAHNIVISGKDRTGFVFKSEDVEIIPFLEVCLENIQELSEEIYYHFDG